MRHGIAALAMVSLWLSMASAEQSVCMDSEMREQARTLMLAGIDQAFRDHAVSMFNGWQKDPIGQPGRAERGMRSAIVAYVGSRKSIQRWNPPLCQ
jgi:hypothetical protein